MAGGLKLESKDFFCRLPPKNPNLSSKKDIFARTILSRKLASLWTRLTDNIDNNTDTASGDDFIALTFVGDKNILTQDLIYLD